MDRTSHEQMREYAPVAMRVEELASEHHAAEGCRTSHCGRWKEHRAAGADALGLPLSESGLTYSISSGAWPLADVAVACGKCLATVAMARDDGRLTLRALDQALRLHLADCPYVQGATLPGSSR